MYPPQIVIAILRLSFYADGLNIYSLAVLSVAVLVNILLVFGTAFAKPYLVYPWLMAALLQVLYSISFALLLFRSGEP